MLQKIRRWWVVLAFLLIFLTAFAVGMWSSSRISGGVSIVLTNDLGGFQAEIDEELAIQVLDSTGFWDRDKTILNTGFTNSEQKGTRYKPNNINIYIKPLQEDNPNYITSFTADGETSYAIGIDELPPNFSIYLYLQPKLAQDLNSTELQDLLTFMTLFAVNSVAEVNSNDGILSDDNSAVLTKSQEQIQNYSDLINVIK